jgi:hypothetical protein
MRTLLSLSDQSGGIGYAANLDTSDKIYNAENCPIHKPEFYAWRKGELPSDSAQCCGLQRGVTQQ